MSPPYMRRRQGNSGCDTRHRQNMESGEWDSMWGIRQADWRGLPCLHWAGRKTGNICVMVVTNPDKYPKVTQEFVFLGRPLAVFDVEELLAALKWSNTWLFVSHANLRLADWGQLWGPGPVFMLVLRLEKLLRVLYSSPLAAQTQGLLRTAWLVCLSLELSRHSTCERGGRLYIYRESPYQTVIKYSILTNDSLTISTIGSVSKLGICL